MEQKQDFKPNDSKPNDDADSEQKQTHSPQQDIDWYEEIVRFVA